MGSFSIKGPLLISFIPKGTSGRHTFSMLLGEVSVSVECRDVWVGCFSIKNLPNRSFSAPDEKAAAAAAKIAAVIIAAILRIDIFLFMGFASPCFMSISMLRSKFFEKIWSGISGTEPIIRSVRVSSNADLILSVIFKPLLCNFVESGFCTA